MTRRARTKTEPAAPPAPGLARAACVAALRARLDGDAGVSLASAAPRLSQLQQVLGLSDADVDVVAALWTASYSPEWRSVLTSRDAFAGHLTVLGLSQTLGHSPRVRLGTESPLLMWRVAVEHPFVEGTAALSLDPVVGAWLDGHETLDVALVGQGRFVVPRFTFDAWKLDVLAARLTGGLKAGDCWRVRVAGQDLLTAETLAAALAQRLGLLLFSLDIEPSPRDEARERAARAQRQAFLDRWAPCWRGRCADVAFPRDVPPFPVQFIVDSGPLTADDRFRDIAVDAGEPGVRERRALWLAAVPGGDEWPDAAIDDLSLRYEASASEILRAGGAGPRNAGEAAQLVRETAIDDLGGLAQRLACPFSWEDLVVPAGIRERLEDVAFEARERTRLWAEPEASRLYPQGRGLVVLLAGPPGTGKTMSAQVIARDLDLDLLRIDMSRVLSKWVGETAQHLQKVLSSPGSKRAVLLFDEADALFGRRIEDARQAQDHFINLDLSHLMIALESYTGVVLLATNLRANMDAAFVRRIRHAIDFQQPDASARRAIWTRAAEALFGSPLSPDIAEAAARVARLDASGAQIKNAALSSVFAARRERRAPDASLFARMLARELAKDGGSLSARELASTIEAPL